MHHDVIAWLTDPASWQGTQGIWAQLGRHVAYTLITLVIAAAIGVPLGLYIGVTGRGERIIPAIVNIARALPSLGVLTVLALLLTAPTGIPAAYFIAMYVTLALLAVPPLMINTYAGIQAVDRDAVDAARGIGLTTRQTLWRVQVPNALPLMMSGLRSATLQVIATATIVDLVTLGGLGRFILGGLGQRDYPQTLGGAVLVAALALVSEGVLILVERLVVSPGLRVRGPSVRARRRTRLARRGVGVASSSVVDAR